MDTAKTKMKKLNMQKKFYAYSQKESVIKCDGNRFCILVMTYSKPLTVNAQFTLDRVPESAAHFLQLCGLNPAGDHRCQELRCLVSVVYFSMNHE